MVEGKIDKNAQSAFELNCAKLTVHRADLDALDGVRVTTIVGGRRKLEQAVAPLSDTL